jgi:hypothetical protein
MISKMQRILRVPLDTDTRYDGYPAAATFLAFLIDDYTRPRKAGPLPEGGYHRIVTLRYQLVSLLQPIYRGV